MNRPLALTVALMSVATWSLAATAAGDASDLGKSLTKFGAIQAGNADGTIPAYEGGLTTAPAGFKPDSGFWVDPFKDEKPLFRIDAKNVDKYADKLSEGQKTLIKKYPSYYIDIYPSHRTTAYPQAVLDATVRNAGSCKVQKDGLAVDPSCRGGLPFPIRRPATK